MFAQAKTALTGKIISKTKRYRQFYRYFLSYIIVTAVVLLVIGYIVYRNFIATLQLEVENSNMSALVQTKNSIDIRLKEMERTALHINSNDSLKPYKTLDDGMNALEAMQELSQYKSGNGFVYDIAVYHKNGSKPKICNTAAVTSLDTFFGYFYAYRNWNKEGFLQLMETMTSSVIRPAEPVLVDNVTYRNFVTYIYPLPLNTSRPNSVVMFLINGEMFKSMINSVLKDYDGFIYILDEVNKPIIYTQIGSGDINALNILEIVGKQNLQNSIGSMEINHKKYSIVKILSEYNRWSYVTVVPTDQLMQKVYAKRNLFNITAFAVLILGSVIAFLLASGNYKPVKVLMDKVSDQVKFETGIYKDEFSVINHAIDTVSLENKGLMAELRSRAGLMKNQKILSLLKGRSGSQLKTADKYDLMDFKLEYPYFTVLIFMIDDYKNFQRNRDVKTLELARFSIINVIEELSMEIGYGFGVELENESSVALLVNIKEGLARERNLSELAFQAKTFIKEHFDIMLTVGVGNIYDSLTMVHEAFLEASRAVYYRLIKGNNSVIFYEDVKDNRKLDYKYPAEQELQLVMAVKKGDRIEVEKITKEIKSYILNHYMAPETVQCICYGIINSVLKSLDEMEVEIDGSLDNEWEGLFIQPFDTIDELGNRVINFCTKICSYMEHNKESKNFEIRDRIIEIVKQRYQDNTLSLESIADIFGMSPSYISRYFKDQTGYPLMQYIDLFKMNEVKRLLKETKLPLKDILQRCGYIDDSNFIRKFKKKEGITPKQYRNMKQENSVAMI